MQFRCNELVTEDELSMLLEHDRIINNKLPIYNKKTMTVDCYSSSKNTLCKEDIIKEVQYKTILLNDNYVDLLYLLLEKRFTYFNELLKLKGINWKHHINKLTQLNIIEIKSIGKELEDFLLFTNTMNKGTLKQARFFKLTSDAALEYGQDILKDYIKSEASNKVVNFVEKQKELFINSKEGIKQKQIQKENEHLATIRNLNIEVMK